MTCDLDAHLRTITAVYQNNCRLMCDLLDDSLPDLTHTHPEGGIFLMMALASRNIFPQGL